MINYERNQFQKYLSLWMFDHKVNISFIKLIWYFESFKSENLKVWFYKSSLNVENDKIRTNMEEDYKIRCISIFVIFYNLESVYDYINSVFGCLLVS